MKLIVNADDFGHSDGINKGIISAYQNGIVRSTTIMAGMDGFLSALALAKENPGLGIGVHLTLTCGKSVGGVYKTITDENGCFLKLGKLKETDADPQEIEKEYRAQIEKVISAGIKPDHLDSHHHTHRLPAAYAVFIKMCREYNLPARMYEKEPGIIAPQVFEESFYERGATTENLKQILLKHSGAESLELMCHPAFPDDALRASSSYCDFRATERQILESDEIKKFIKEQGITLATFGQL